MQHFKYHGSDCFKKPECAAFQFTLPQSHFYHWWEIETQLLANYSPHWQRMSNLLLYFITVITLLYFISIYKGYDKWVHIIVIYWEEEHVCQRIFLQLDADCAATLTTKHIHDLCKSTQLKRIVQETQSEQLAGTNWYWWLNGNVRQHKQNTLLMCEISSLQFGVGLKAVNPSPVKTAQHSASRHHDSFCSQL